MNFLKQHASSVILCLFEILVGILLLINAEKFTAAIIAVFGIVLIVTGLISIIGYFRIDAVQAAASQALFKGLLALIIGIFCVVRTGWLTTSVLPVIAVLYGAAVLIAGLVKVQWSVNLIRLKLGKWGLPAVSAAISIICGAVIMCNPFETLVVLWIFTGVSLILEAALDIAALVMVSAAGE